MLRGHGTDSGRGPGGAGGGRGNFRGSFSRYRGDGRGGGRGRGGAMQHAIEVYTNNNPRDPKVAQAEEALHPITKKISQLSNLGVSDRLPLRPGYGTKGVTVELTANDVEILPPSDVALYRYSIQITPEPRRKTQFRLLELLLQSEELASKKGELATDFQSTFESKVKLPTDEIVVKIQNRAEGEDEPPGGPPSTMCGWHPPAVYAQET